MTQATAMLPAQGVSECSDDLRTQLQRLLSSEVFRRSPRLSQFLAFTVGHIAAGDASKLKEYTIAVEVFGKPDSFDPRMDSSVRVAARQLRAKLDRYYATEGRGDRVLIRFRPGDYAPRIYVRESDSASAAAPETVAMRDVIIADRERQMAHSVAECLDPADYRVLAIADDGERVLSMIDHPLVLVCGLHLSGGLSGCELIQRARNEKHCGAVAAVSGAGAGMLLADVATADPDAVVFRPVRKPDVEAAIKLAAYKAASRARGI